jgi:localization factor PodJL
MTQGPWSVKGIDPKARSVARERAHSRGVTLGQYLNALLLEADAPAGGDRQVRDVEIEDLPPRVGGDTELRRMSVEIDMLSERLEASQARSARAVSGLDKSILSLMGKVEASGKAQLGALERVTRAMSEIETTQGALRSRIDSLEANNGGGPTLTALKALESSLGRLAESVQERLNAVEAGQGEFRNQVEDKVNRVFDKVDEFGRNLDQAIGTAVRNAGAGMGGRVDQIEQQVSGIERRMDGALSRITDAASRFEQFDTKAEKVANEAGQRIERSLETHLNRSRQMSKELLDRVDGIEERTREGITSLSDAVARITERISRAERKTDTASEVLKQSVNEIDERVARFANRSPEQDFAQIQSLFQKRLDSLAEDLSRPIHAVRADVERRLEEALRTNSPEKIDKLEHTIRQMQDQIRISETRQADAVETMSAQVERLSRAVDDRLRAVEARGDQRSVEDVRREMLRLADVIDARLGQTETASRSASGAVEALRSDIGRLNTSVDDRIQAFEQRNAAAIETVGSQVSVVAERMQRRHDEGIQRLADRIAETAQATRSVDPAEMDRLGERLDERVKESERRSAEALGQIGEQVARVADRLQTQNQDTLRAFEARLADSGRTHEARLSEVLSDMSRRMDEIGEHSASALAPVHKTVSSIARRLETLEDYHRPPSSAPLAPAVSRDIPAVADEFVFLEDESERQPAPPAPAALAVTDAIDAGGIAGVDPPPFDRGRDAELFEEQKPVHSEGPVAEPASKIDDLLDTDDVVLAATSPIGKGFVADPILDNLGADRPAPGYIEQARRAARENRNSGASNASGRKGIGKGPLIASAALAVAVAGGGAFTVMRGKQEAKGDDFAKLDPSAPVAGQSNPDAAASVLFGDTPAQPQPNDAARLTTREPAAADLFDEPAKPGAKLAPAAPTAAAAKAAPAEPPVITLADAVRQGDPIALHDYALELLQSGEKSKGVAMMKDAAKRGLVMAEYRLAKLYEKGEGVPRDMAASRSWTEKAAIGGNVKAMHDLAVFYAEGDAGPQSYAAAVEWFRQASDMGLVDSQYNLAVLYEQGLGLTQDKPEAAYWFEVAGRAGDQDAARRARALFGDLPGAQAEQLKRRARAFNPKPSIARANGEFGRRAWDVATPTQLAEAQRLLERLGYSPGGSDGKLTVQTQNAIKAFQSDNELPVTGEASVTLLRQLRTAAITTDN